MNKQEIEKIYSTFDDFDRTLFSELTVCCAFMNDLDFENLFQMQELSESAFFSVIDFLYHQDCFLMLFKLFAKHLKRIQAQEFSSLQDVELQDYFENRLEKIIKNYESIFY